MRKKSGCRGGSPPEICTTSGSFSLRTTQSSIAPIWSSEDVVRSQLYGVVAIDPAAADLVVRQRDDRRGETERLTANLRRAGRLKAGAETKRFTALLMWLTSYDSFRELRSAALRARSR